MLRGYYTAASGMIAEQRRQEMLTNNLANANTPGFKADQASLRGFQDMLIEKLGGTPKPGSQQIGDLNTGVYLQETTPDFSQGPVKNTNQSTDIALVASNMPKDPKTQVSSALFFATKMSDGSTGYTRNGHFNVDPKGRLVTSQGNLVLDSQNNPIQVNTTDFKVGPHGTIREGRQVVGQLNIAYAQNPNQLVKVGNDLYKLANGTLPTVQQAGVNATFDTKQGFLEQSNVSPEQTMSEMMMAFRNFEANQKVLQTYDRSMDKAVNEVGKIG